MSRLTYVSCSTGVSSGLKSQLSQKWQSEPLMSFLRSKGLHWVWAPAGPNANLMGAEGFALLQAGVAGRAEHFVGDPWGPLGFGVE